MSVKVLKKNPIEAETSIKHPDGSIEEVKEVVGQVISDSNLANVGVTVANTINLGNYNSIKISVSLYHPSEPKNIDDTFDMVESWCSDKLQLMYKKIQAEINQE